MRQMVIPRKGQSPAGQPPADAGDTEDASDGGADEASEGEGGEDVETCPNCACQFIDGDDGADPKVVKPGKPVEGGSDYKPKNEGADLDTIDSAEPTPGKFGTAHDAAGGSAALAQLLGPLLAAGH